MNPIDLAFARDICYHRGVPLRLGQVEGDEIVCKKTFIPNEFTLANMPMQSVTELAPTAWIAKTRGSELLSSP